MMKVVVIGGTGLIGRQVVAHLQEWGHDALPASPNTGVNTITGQGLDAALAGAQVVVDVANSPSFEDAAVLEFFETSGRNLLNAESQAGVAHHVALTIVGAERVPDSGYMRAKSAQERLIESSDVPYTIVRATQFYEFLAAIADSATVGDTVRIPTARIQPMAAADVALAVAQAAIAEPVNGTVEIAGPERIAFPQLLADVLRAAGDPRTVVGDEQARYFGTHLTDESITAGPQAQLGATRFAEWLAASHT